MTYPDALDFIHSIARFGSKPGLRRVKMLLERMGNPQNSLRFLHVAGTNGKGSTCSMLSHILSRAGYRTGLYISPFVIDFRERIQLDNEMISQEDMAEVTGYVKTHWDALDAMGETPTEFEVVVAVAMEYFKRNNCDVVVLEVGMGGRYDATNVIGTPLVSVITSISIDHTQYLGDTIGEIAVEKAGIIKPGGVTVTYPRQDPEALAVIMEHCAREDNRLFQPGAVEILDQSIEGNRFRYRGLEVFVPMAGEHQVYNAMTVMETCKALELTTIHVSDEDIVDGIAETRFPSRMEVLHRDPMVILDGAHNQSGAEALSQSLELLRGKRIHALMGLSEDKDAQGMLSLILPHCASVTVTRSSSFKAMPFEQLAEVARQYCDEVTVVSTNAEDAFVQVIERCKKDEVLLICGSLYLTADLRAIALGYFGE